MGKQQKEIKKRERSNKFKWKERWYFQKFRNFQCIFSEGGAKVGKVNEKRKMVNKILERYFLFRIDCKHISYHCVFGTKREISTKQNREEKKEEAT